MIVVDASVAVKWLLPEAGDKEAQRILDADEELVGPTLIQVEVAAALVRKARLKELDVQDAENAADLWWRSIADGVIRVVPEQADLPRAFKLALTLKHPLQDCIYLALAERIGARFITADAKFAGKARKLFPRLELLQP